MRTTITLDQDVEAAVARLRKQRSLGLSEAVNELVRAGLKTKRAPREFRQKTHSLGIKIDVTNIPEALELLEGPEAR